MVECETCGFEITALQNVETGEIVSCSQCGEEFEVIETGPLKLTKAPVIEEDFGE